MKIYAVSKKEYEKFRTNEIEKIQEQASYICTDDVITSVDFSTRDKDFSVVNSALLGLLRKQYETGTYISQNELETIEEDLEKIEKNELETLSEALWNHDEFKSVDDIINIIKNIDNYMMVYLTNEEELGHFIVENLDIYIMPTKTLDNIESHLNFKAIAEEYLFDHDIRVIAIEDVVLDISKNKNDQLVQKLIEKKLDSKTINAEKYSVEKSQELEETFEYEGNE